ncbi:hypothetical protein DPMN_140992 [Dreissena polymorpha]|uniref:Uncharacterized protein n=1 Tax=Dreissena polymorpha TaxID=45954 RepID=A0A9D4JM78_DREPO|nr:hypothetical protein DPMN_140992 [Dreissena polymorpha]
MWCDINRAKIAEWPALKVQCVVSGNAFVSNLLESDDQEGRHVSDGCTICGGW